MLQSISTRSGIVCKQAAFSTTFQKSFRKIFQRSTLKSPSHTPPHDLPVFKAPVGARMQKITSESFRAAFHSHFMWFCRMVSLKPHWKEKLFSIPTHQIMWINYPFLRKLIAAFEVLISVSAISHSISHFQCRNYGKLAPVQSEKKHWFIIAEKSNNGPILTLLITVKHATV